MDRWNAAFMAALRIADDIRHGAPDGETNYWANDQWRLTKVLTGSLLSDETLRAIADPTQPLADLSEPAAEVVAWLSTDKPACWDAAAASWDLLAREMVLEQLEIRGLPYALIGDVVAAVTEVLPSRHRWVATNWREWPLLLSDVYRPIDQAVKLTIQAAVAAVAAVAHTIKEENNA